MRLRSLKSSAKSTRLGLETLEHKMLLAADIPTSSGQQDDLDNSPVNQTAETVDNNLVVLPGDATRDGVFDQQDLIQLFLAGKYLTGEAADWSEGDWNGDNVFDQRDVIAALQIGNYAPHSQSANGNGPPDEGNQSVLTLLAAEEAARIAADTVLHSQIDAVEAAEEAARLAAFTELQGQIVAVEAAEEAARLAADADLQVQIDRLASTPPHVAVTLGPFVSNRFVPSGVPSTISSPCPVGSTAIGRSLTVDGVFPLRSLDLLFDGPIPFNAVAPSSWAVGVRSSGAGDMAPGAVFIGVQAICVS